MTADFSIKYQNMINLVPSQLRNPTVVSLVDNLFNRFLTVEETIPFYGYVGTPSEVTSNVPLIKQISNERYVNTLIPVYSFKVGSKDYSFTPEDIINKMLVLGASSNQSTWLYSQSNNYSPPINLDKFANFYNYYWVAKALPNVESLSWNPDLIPEYYCIEKPSASDLNKLNVKTATNNTIVLTGSGFYDQVWELTFNSANTLTIKANGPQVGFLAGQQLQNFTIQTIPSTPSNGEWVALEDILEFKAGNPLKTLITFKIRREPIFDASGNLIQYETFAANDKFTIEAPFISNSYSINFSGSIGIKGQIVSVNSLDEFQTVSGVTVTTGDRVLVKNNPSSDNAIYVVSGGIWQRAEDFNSTTASAGVKVWVSSGANARNMYTSVVNSTGWEWQLIASDVESNTNDWQQYNFWMSKSEIEQLGLSWNDVTQAVRPIIEYKYGLKLNSFVKDGKPADAGIEYTQLKTQVNQVPLFDIYRYDGTHNETVSSVFFYVEDHTQEIDPALQKRVKYFSTESNDFVFDHGLYDDNGSTLFYKLNGDLKSIWHPGYSTPTLVDQTFDGVGNGSLSVSLANVSPYISQQIWTLTAISSTQFKVAGSKNKVINSPYDIITVGVPYQYVLFSANISQGSVPFQVGDTFTFRVGNLETARYSRVLPNGEICDVCGGFENDSIGIGAWKIPKMFYVNTSNQSGAELPEGTINSHFKSILNNQPNGTTENRSFGGSIKLWSEPVNLLSSLMMQRDVTPISIIDLAERQYQNGYLSIITLYQKNVLPYIEANGVIDNQGKLNTFVDHLLNLRALDEDVKTVLYDSSAPVKGFPPTLPQLGVCQVYSPQIVLDDELDIVALKRHDGSLFPLFVNNSNFLDQFVVPGTTLPQDLAALLNDVFYQIELRFFTGISSQQKHYFTDEEITNAISGPLGSYLHRELATWAASNNYDIYGSDYEAGNAFTWNYSSANTDNCASVASGTIPARWFNFLQSHHSTVLGVLPTSRPDLYPWKLIGVENDPGTVWDVYRSEITPDALNSDYIDAGEIDAVLYSQIGQNTSLSGLPIIDGYQTQENDRILLASENFARNNGLWRVSSGTWTRDSQPLIEKTVVKVKYGQLRNNTYWYLINTVANINVDDVNFVQVRRWTDSMWEQILLARPELKLSVNPFTDELLPPYVSESLIISGFALTNVIPSGTANSYQFGESSPVETAWTRTSEFRYSLARALFRKDPLGWLDSLWGFEWLNVDNIAYCSSLVTMPHTKSLPIHGENSIAVTRKVPLSFSGITGIPNSEISIVRDCFTTDSKQGWTVFANGQILGYLKEGITHASISSSGFTFSNLKIEDEGRPFGLGDKFTISLDANGNVATSFFIEKGIQLLNGFGQIFSFALRNSSLYDENNYALKAYRSWVPYLGYRASGLVSTEDLKINANNGDISSAAYDLRLKKSRYTKDSWLHALRVKVKAFGSSYKSGDAFIPASDASNWTFVVEGYNDRYTQISFYEVDTSGSYVTFNALDSSATKLEWKKFDKTNTLQTTHLPLTIVGLQNVINFLFGYEYKLIEDGWSFEDPTSSNIDAETGRAKSWQLEIEKLVDRVFRGIQEDQGTVINPFLDKMWINHSRGLLSEFYDNSLFDISSDPALFDVLGTKIKISELNILRQREKSEITSTVPIFSAHMQIDEFEHLFVFNKYAIPSTREQLIYDEFSGAQISNLKFNGRYQGNGSLRPEVGGYFLVDGELQRNIKSSIDSIAHLYDSDKVFENSKTSKHALSLLGFNLKEYMADLDLTDKTQFNFWRGLIHMKGTNESVSAFLNNGKFLDTELDEFWAYKVAEYGDSRSKFFPELKIQSADAIQQFTKLQFDSSTPLVDFTQISSIDEDRWFSIDDLSNQTKFEIQNNGEYSIKNGTNLIDTSWWNTGATLPLGWTLHGSIPENQFSNVDSYYDTTEVLWVAEAGAAGSSFGGPDGGWEIGGFSKEIDRNSSYRFILPVKRQTSQSGTVQFGLTGIADLNSVNESGTKFFASVELPESDVWYAIVGYVYALGSTGNTNAGSGLFKISTGELVESGLNFNWHDILPIRHTARLVDAQNSTRVVFGKPAAHKLDGFEPSIADIFAGTRKIVKLPFVSDKLIITGDAETINSTTIQFSNPYPIETTILGFAANTDSFTPVKLINYVENELVEDISLWHPAAGYHNPIALESINIISTKDPARYNVSTQIVGNDNYDPLRTWGSKEVGRIWLDTTNLKYVPYYDSTIFANIEERLNRWGTLADYGSINVMEWVESTVPPSRYEAQAVLDNVNPDIPNNLKSEGTVYGATTYSRNRIWGMRPIAWSFAGRPNEAAHINGMIGSRGSFSASYNSGLYFVEDLNGVGEVLLDSGTFQSFGIMTGMHFGEFEDTPAQLRARSENVITSFSKAVYFGTGDNYTVITSNSRFDSAEGQLDGLNANISIDLEGNTPLAGEIIFSSRNEVIPIYDTDGVTTGKQVVKSYLRARVPGSSIDEEILVREDQGSAGVQLYAIDTAAVLAGLNQAASNIEPGKTLFKDTLIGSRPLGDLTNELDVNLADVANYQAWVDGTITDVDIINYIENVFNSFILSNQTTYSAYIQNVEIISTETTTLTLEPNQVFNFEFQNLGMTINLETLNDTTVTVPSTTLASLVVQELNDNNQLRIFDSARYDVIIPGLGLTYLTNDFTDPSSFADDSGQGGIGWRAWSIPAQEQLDADTKYPNSSWYPLVGPLTTINTPLITDIQQIASSNGQFTLNNGTSVKRYETSWDNWIALNDTLIEQTAVNSGIFEITLPEKVDSSRLSVYKNGSAQLTGTYQLVGDNLTIQSVKFGDEITIIIRPYSPTAEELAFDPDTEDDLLIQNQFKVNYQYVEIPVRDNSGNILSTKYFFWVKNRSITSAKKKLSVKSIEAFLRNGPDQFLTFQNLVNGDYYDAITIAGLSQIVAKDDTFKLRFMRDFTLRDNPNGLDLKDTHTEWALIRPKQRLRIPEKLWLKMVDSACGKDLAGNQIPSARRIAYDERNGSSSRYGFGADQILADSGLIKSTILYTILNTKLVDTSGDGISFTDYMTFLDFSSYDTWFENAESTRQILTDIWNKGKASQINEVFFAVLEDIVASNYELTDIFKTSRLSVQSTREVNNQSYTPSYE